MDNENNQTCGTSNEPEVKTEPGAGGDYVVRIRGLPWSASKDDIVKFFEGAKMKNGPQGIHLTMSREGRPSGEAYIELETQEDMKTAMAKDNEHLGSRYIEVFESKKDEMDWNLRRCGLDGEEAFGDACVRLRGLPFGCSKEEIAQFFTGLEIVRNGITLPTDFQGRSTGEAYVQFSSQDIAEKAMGKHKDKIGHRYIEIFKSSLQEIRSALGMGPMRTRNMGSNRSSPYDRMDRPGFGGGGGGGYGRGGSGRNFGNKRGFDDDFRGSIGIGGPYSTPSGRGGMAGGMGRRGGGGRMGDFFGEREEYSTGHRVHMRGLPFRAVERDIYDFFAPVNPASVQIQYEPSGRASGEADVEFNTHEEALKAMKRDKEKIQHRYIELFMHSEPEPFPRGGGGGGGGGGMGVGGGFGNMRGGGVFPSGDESGFGGPTANRSFGQPGNARGGRPFMPDNDRSFGNTADRSYGGGVADRSFGTAGTDRGFGFPATDNRGFAAAGVARTFGQTPVERFANAGGDRYGMGGDNFGNRPMENDYRNGMPTTAPSTMNYGAAIPTGAGPITEIKKDFFPSIRGMETKEDTSEFYGSRNMYDENFQQSSGMVGGSNYTSF